MKLLAIHSNELFFGKATNFYEWLAGQRDLSGFYLFLKKKYNKSKVSGPLLLRKTYNLVVGGLTKRELRRYCKQYCTAYLNNEVEWKLKSKRKKTKMRIVLFGSYPQELYEEVEVACYANKSYGVASMINDTEKITGLDNIRLDYGGTVRLTMNEIGFGNRFTPEPDRYGMLACLIDEIIGAAGDSLLRKDIVILGKGITAKPMHKVAGRVIESLDEL